MKIPIVKVLAMSLALVLWPTVTFGFNFITISNPDWEICVTSFGYSDVALDKRPGYAGREYLSGEWAGAVHYQGGENPTEAIWLEPAWLFPNWNSNSDFDVQTHIHSTGVNNVHGFAIYKSVITNADLQIVITYQMLDTTNGIAQGMKPKSGSGSGGSFTNSNRYVFKQTHSISNRLSQPLTNLRFYQFLHGLSMHTALYDDREYSGALNEYRYDLTQIGTNLWINRTDGKIVLHHDFITLHSKVAPQKWDVGHYGIKGTHSHVTGKPSVGVHHKVETNSLDNLDFFQPPTKWVSGAQQYSLAELPASGSVTLELIFSLGTTTEEKTGPIDLPFRHSSVVTNSINSISNKTFIINFEDKTTPNPYIVGYNLLSKNFLGSGTSPIPGPGFDGWIPTGILCTTNINHPNIKQFPVPLNSLQPHGFFIVVPKLIDEDVD